MLMLKNSKFLMISTSHRLLPQKYRNYAPVTLLKIDSYDVQLYEKTCRDNFSEKVKREQKMNVDA